MLRCTEAVHAATFAELCASLNTAEAPVLSTVARRDLLLIQNAYEMESYQLLLKLNSLRPISLPLYARGRNTAQKGLV